MIAYIDRELLPAPTIRHVECEVLLTAGSKQQQCCRACCRHRGSLRSLLSRRKVASPKATTLAHSHTNDRYLSTPKRKEKVKRQRVNLKEQRRRIRKLKRTVKKLTRDGMMVDNATHEDLVTIMEENVKEVASKYPEKSFPRLFWSQQLQAAKQKNSKSMKWHPVMVRWCIYLRQYYAVIACVNAISATQSLSSNILTISIASKMFRAFILYFVFATVARRSMSRVLQ